MCSRPPVLFPTAVTGATGASQSSLQIPQHAKKIGRHPGKLTLTVRSQRLRPSDHRDETTETSDQEASNHQNQDASSARCSMSRAILHLPQA